MHPRRLVVSWLAILAVLVATLAPTLAQALGMSPPPWVEVCTSAGMQRVGLGSGRSSSHEPSAPTGAHAFEHCSACSLHAHAPLLPVAPAARFERLTADRAVACREARATHVRLAWHRALARAPPVTG